MAYSTAAQPSTTDGDGEHSVESSSQARNTSANDLREEQDAYMPDNCTEMRGKFHKVWKMFPSSKSKQKVSRKLERMTTQRNPQQMDEFMTTLKSCDESVQYNRFQLEESWQRIQGSNCWKDGLLDPNHLLYPSLAAEIYRYGTFAKATYDAFDRKSNSRHRDCKYKEKELLQKVGLENRGYEISQFLYATAQLRLPKFLSRLPVVTCRKSSNWIGFVAVCTNQDEIARLGRRDIVVAWRGTNTKAEWVKDLQFWWKPVEYANMGTVESGFLSVYNSSNEEFGLDKKSAKDQVLEAVKKLVTEYEGEYKEKGIKLSITITGHSLGSALAILCAYDIAVWLNQHQQNSSFGSGSGGVARSEKASGRSSPNDRIPVTVFSFAGPRVCNRVFKMTIEKLGVKVLRVINKHDIVPKVPCLMFSSYEHVGTELDINSLRTTTENADEPTGSPKEEEKNKNKKWWNLRGNHSIAYILDILACGCNNPCHLVVEKFKSFKAVKSFKAHFSGDYNE